jgi:wobble nucleotide-excising tRNase
MLERLTLGAGLVPFEDNQVIEIKLVNFVFGNNATGKTTISRLIKRASQTEDSRVSFTDKEEEIIVFNTDFTKSAFRYSDTIPGVFTLGEDRKGNEDRISRLKNDLVGCRNEFDKNKINLRKVRNEINELMENMEALCWEETKEIRERFDFALSGFKRKAAFFQRCIENLSEERCTETVDFIFNEVSRAFSKEIETLEEVKPVDLSRITKLEQKEILKKRIVGDKTLDISRIIDIYHISDWVKQGLTHFDSTKPVCPFCQQKMANEIYLRLYKYFDKQYEQDIKELADFEIAYARLVDDISSYIYSITTGNINGYDYRELNDLLVEITHIFEINLKRIQDKKAEPSVPIELISIVDKIVAANLEIEKLNITIQENNQIARFRSKHIERVTALLFSFISNNILHTALIKYSKTKDNLRKAETGIGEKAKSLDERITELEKQIGEIESKLTSVELTAKQMQDALSSYGYNSFTITTTEDKKCFRLLRPNGDKVEDLLSEGELRFVSFLYFYFLIFGSENPTISNKKKVVVIDDPICSMDNQALFLALGLIHQIIEKCLKKDIITQVVVLTHNIFFYLNLIEPYKNKRRGNIDGNVNYIWL